jgi:SAM-dependent methyltransferase
MTPEELFWTLHEGLPRQGPGSDDTTRRLLSIAAPPPGARALDVGCGPGRSTLVLAADGLRVTAVDLHQPFLDELTAAAAARGLADRVDAAHVDMAALPYPDGAFDLIWAEGSAYVLGFRTALTQWRRLLKPGGVLVLTEAELTTLQPAERVQQFWKQAYPGMRSTPENVAHAMQCGYTVAATYLLPHSDWWEEYYSPLETRVERFAADPAITAEAQLRLTLGAVREEIELRLLHPGDYGYTGYVLRRRD